MVAKAKRASIGEQNHNGRRARDGWRAGAALERSCGTGLGRAAGGARRHVEAVWGHDRRSSARHRDGLGAGCWLRRRRHDARGGAPARCQGALRRCRHFRAADRCRPLARRTRRNPSALYPCRCADLWFRASQLRHHHLAIRRDVFRGPHPRTYGAQPTGERRSASSRGGALRKIHS